ILHVLPISETTTVLTKSSSADASPGSCGRHSHRDLYQRHFVKCSLRLLDGQENGVADRCPDWQNRREAQGHCRSFCLRTIKRNPANSGMSRSDRPHTFGTRGARNLQSSWLATKSPLLKEISYVSGLSPTLK